MLFDIICSAIWFILLNGIAFFTRKFFTCIINAYFYFWFVDFWLSLADVNLFNKGQDIGALGKQNEGHIIHFFPQALK